MRIMNSGHEGRSVRILEAAEKEFLKRGYDAVTLTDIAAKAGVSRSGLRGWFKNKDEILAAVARRFLEPIFLLFWQANNEPTAALGLSYFIREYIRHWHSHRKELEFHYLSLARTIEIPAFRTLHGEYSTQMRAFYEGLYHKGCDSGEFRKIDPSTAALSLMAALDGMVAWITATETLDPDEVTRRFTDMFVLDLVVKRP